MFVFCFFLFFLSFFFFLVFVFFFFSLSFFLFFFLFFFYLIEPCLSMGPAECAERLNNTRID